jgi:hypothetical protein
MNEYYSCLQNAPAGKGYDSMGKIWSLDLGSGTGVYEANEVQNIPFTLLDWKLSTVQTVSMK